MTQTFDEIQWVKVVLSKTEYADAYPFLRFFTAPIQANKFRNTIVTINDWLKDNSRNSGLLIVGPDSKERSHLLYLTAYAAQLKIVNAKDIMQKAFIRDTDGRMNWETVVNNYSYDRHAIDFLGEEVTTQNSPIVDIIYKLWSKGQGIIAGTSLTQKEFGDKYGTDALAIVNTSCIRAKWPTNLKEENT